MRAKIVTSSRKPEVEIELENTTLIITETKEGHLKIENKKLDRELNIRGVYKNLIIVGIK